MTSSFTLDEETKNKISELTQKYSTTLAALLPALNLVQDKYGFIPPEVEPQIAELLNIYPIQVREVVSFYSLFYSQPIGHNRIYVCNNLSCCLEGSGKIIKHLKEKLKIQLNETTSDGKFSLYKSPCIGACEKAPAIIVNGKYHYNVTIEYIDKLLSELG
jgi:NADH-quinone oxidoreductase subunit E